MHVSHDPTNTTWNLTWDDLRYRLRLHAGALTCDYFGPADRFAPPTEWPVADPIQMTRTEARVGLAPADRPVRWAYQSSSQSDESLFTITLAGTDAPIESELRFRLDQPTGLLLRETTLRHT